MVISMVNYHAKSKRFIYFTQAMKSWPLNTKLSKHYYCNLRLLATSFRGQLFLAVKTISDYLQLTRAKKHWTLNQ